MYQSTLRMMLRRMKNTSVTTRACFDSPALAAGMGGTSPGCDSRAREAYHPGRERDAPATDREGEPGECRAKGCRLSRNFRVFIQCKRCAIAVNGIGCESGEGVAKGGGLAEDAG